MKKYALFVIYALLFLLFLFKMFYYREEIYYVPDEEAHISYLAYLEENQGTIVPEFENMRLCEGGLYDSEGIYQYVIHDSTCYLGHPPLYYMFMHLVGGIVTEDTEEGHYVYVDLDRLKTANIYLTGLAMILILYIGYSRLVRMTRSLVVHGIYAVAAVSVPMLSLCGSGITNDNLANLGVAVFMLGVLRYYEEKKGYLTYFLVAAGFFLSVMSKLTVGEFLVIMLLVILAADVIRKKNFGLVWNKYFLATLPVYLIAGSYFLVLLVRYGSIQPGLDVIAPAEQSFVAEAERAEMDFFGYIPYFLRCFGYSWTGLYNGRFFDFKMIDAWKGAVFHLIFYAPFVYVIISGTAAMIKRERQTPVKQGGRSFSTLYLAAAVGLAVTVATQLIKGYGSFASRGYMGGYQARYYLCDIPFMALALADGIHRLMGWRPGEDMPGWLGRRLPAVSPQKVYRSIVSILGTAIILLMLYGDFIYFLMHHEY